MARMTGGQALVETLRRHGVDTLFALPGVQNDALFNALYDAGGARAPTRDPSRAMPLGRITQMRGGVARPKGAEPAIRVIHTRHEQGAAYMAYGYAKSTGKVGAYAVVPGPGVLNTTAALATAYAANARV